MSLVQSEVLDNQKLNHKFNLIRLKCLESAFNFEAGQFVVIQVNDTVSRAYSIASLPSQLPIWELFVDITPGGPGTTKLQSLKKGDIIRTSLPRGTFKVRGDGGGHVVMGATGCGLAAIKPVLQSLLPDSKRESIKLFWGLRYEEDICHEDTLKKLQQQYPHFQYEIILSRPQNGWPGKVGHITTFLSELVQNHTAEELSLYLCGNSQMIVDTIKLVQSNLPMERIYFERHY